MDTASETNYTFGDNLRNILATAATTAILSLPFYTESGIIPSKFHEIKNDVAIYDSGKSSINSYPYYKINTNNELMVGLEILNKFVARVLKESEELEPHIAKLINKHFWKLV
jgi:hypothetical protein